MISIIENVKWLNIWQCLKFFHTFSFNGLLIPAARYFCLFLYEHTGGRDKHCFIPAAFLYDLLIDRPDQDHAKRT